MSLLSVLIFGLLDAFHARSDLLKDVNRVLMVVPHDTTAVHSFDDHCSGGSAAVEAEARPAGMDSSATTTSTHSRPSHACMTLEGYRRQASSSYAGTVRNST